MSIVYLNGEFLPKDEARVSVLDRGFLFGDGVYEVIPVYGGRLFRLEQHLDRLDQSLVGIRLANPHTRPEWRQIIGQLVELQGGGDQSVYLQVTRGAAPKRDHAFPADVRATVFAMSSPLTPNPPEVAQQGVAAITLEDIRWKYCHIKAVTLLANVLLRQQALDGGAVESILIRDGEVTEGAASNVFIVRAGELLTPPKGPFLLPGITRDLILELAAANGIPHREAAITEADLASAAEIWVTSSTREILPVTTLNGVPVGNGKPGPQWTRMAALFQAYKECLRSGEAN
ncbi:MAG: D-amino acid aminotransferase [Gammaproteobacteria bacterium]